MINSGCSQLKGDWPDFKTKDFAHERFLLQPVWWPPVLVYLQIRLFRFGIATSDQSQLLRHDRQGADHLLISSKLTTHHIYCSYSKSGGMTPKWRIYHSRRVSQFLLVHEDSNTKLELFFALGDAGSVTDDVINIIKNLSSRTGKMGYYCNTYGKTQTWNVKCSPTYLWFCKLVMSLCVGTIDLL